MKNKYTTIGIILTTILLAGVAIFTAIRLYQTRNTAVAPNVPSSRPAAAGEACNPLLRSIQCGKGEERCLQTGSDPSVGICGIPPILPPIIPPIDPPINSCQLTFTLSVSTTTPTPTVTTTATATVTATPTATSTSTSSSNPTATATATVTATASPNPQCNISCTSNSNCPSGLMCYIPSGSTNGNCRNTQCLSETDCTCAVTTPAPTTQPTLPVVGTTWPTIVGTGFGIMVIIGSLLLAL